MDPLTFAVGVISSLVATFLFEMFKSIAHRNSRSRRAPRLFKKSSFVRYTGQLCFVS